MVTNFICGGGGARIPAKKLSHGEEIEQHLSGKSQRAGGGGGLNQGDLGKGDLIKIGGGSGKPTVETVPEGSVSRAAIKTAICGTTKG